MWSKDMSKYIYQKFLLKCDYETVILSNFTKYDGNINLVLDYKDEYCMIDIGNSVIRKVNIDELDENIDTEEDWNNFVKCLQSVDKIILYYEGTKYSNPIIANYREATIKAYLCRLMQLGKTVFLNMQV